MAILICQNLRRLLSARRSPRLRANPVDESDTLDEKPKQAEENFSKEFASSWTFLNEGKEEQPQSPNNSNLPMFLDEYSKLNPRCCPIKNSSKYCNEWADHPLGNTHPDHLPKI